MPELPEVETVCRGLNHLLDLPLKVQTVHCTHLKLRQALPEDAHKLCGQKLRSINRRGKNLIWQFDHHCLINHLGMTGSWRQDQDEQKHDHFVMHFRGIKAPLRYRDPRRFGLIRMSENSASNNISLTDDVLCKLGPEPQSRQFNKKYLLAFCHKRAAAIKNCIMDQACVVGVGNIYASESLFRAGILPNRPGNSINEDEAQKLVSCIKKVIGEAIKAGGSTISDFRQAGGSSGYFQHRFRVYGREGEPCKTCGATIINEIIGQRSSFYCAQCQH